VSPSDVTLLVGVPLGEASFLRAFARGSDYLTEYRTRYRAAAAAYAAYAPAARAMEGLCLDCRALGATVILDATAADVARQAARARVLVLLTHMAFPPLREADVRDGPALVDRVARGEEPEWEILRAVLPCPASVSTVVDAFNVLCAETQKRLDAAPVSDLREAAASIRQGFGAGGLLRFDRPRIDELCGPAVLAPATGIELAGGMISAAQLIAAFPSNYEGFVDLRMCNSIAVGAALRRAQPGAQIAVSKRKVRPDLSLALLKAALGLLSQRGPSLEYDDAMRRVRKELR
jgi:hypothetical protein